MLDIYSMTYCHTALHITSRYIQNITLVYLVCVVSGLFFEPLLLVLKRLNLLFELLDLIVLLSDVVEEREVVLLVLDESAHELVDVGDARRRFDLVERFLKVLRSLLEVDFVVGCNTYIHTYIHT
jgi:hypothetical protein